MSYQITGKQSRIARAYLGLSQTEAAVRASRPGIVITKSAVSRFENGGMRDNVTRWGLQKYYLSRGVVFDEDGINAGYDPAAATVWPTAPRPAKDARVSNVTPFRRPAGSFLGVPPRR